MESASAETKSKAWASHRIEAPEDGSFVHAVKRLCLRQPSLESASLENSSCSLPDLNVSAPCDADVTLLTPPHAASLDCLSSDLLLHVLRLAQPTAWDLCRMACVSRAWRDACYNRIFWTKLRVGAGSMRPGVESLAARCGGLVELHIDDPRCELYVLHPMVVACGASLRRVAINCDMDSSNRHEASVCSILWIISLYCKNVETVELLSDGRSGGFSYLENKALWYLTSGFRNIRSFASQCQDSISRQSLYLMVIAWRDLTCLRIHCGLLGRDDLTSLRKCHSLRILELVGGSLGAMVGQPSSERSGNSGREVVVHARLEVVVLSDVTCEPNDVVALCQQCPGLRRLLMSRGCWAQGDSVTQLVRLHSQFKLLQAWLGVAKGVELMFEE